MTGPTTQFPVVPPPEPASDLREPPAPAVPAKEPVPPQTVTPPSSTVRATTATTKGTALRQYWISFWWWLLMPIDCVDLKTGLPDHDRLVSTGLGVVFVVLLLRLPSGVWPPALISIAFIAAIFGPRMFVKFLVRSQLGATDASSTTTKVDVDVAAILARRKQGGDFEPTP